MWLTGHRPPATERLTMPVLRDGEDPVLVVPTLEAPDAARTPGGTALTLRDGSDGKDPYEAAVSVLGPRGRSVSVTVTEDGGRRLNNTPRELATVE